MLLSNQINIKKERGREKETGSERHRHRKKKKGGRNGEKIVKKEAKKRG